MRLYSLSFIVAGGLCVGGAAAGQTTVRTPETSYERGCRGHAVDVRLDMFTKLPASYPVVTGVEAGSPSAVAGLQVGDSIKSQGGVEFTEGVPPQRYAVGDTVRLVVRRGGRDRPVVLVLGRRAMPAPGAPGGPVCRPATAGK